MRARVWLGFVAAIASACSDGPGGTTAPTPVPTPTPALHLSGRMVDVGSGAAVAGVRARFIGRSASGSALPDVQTVSDASGTYTVDLPVGADAYSLELTSDRPQSGLLRIPGKRLETDLLVNGGPCAIRYGNVFDAVTRQPVAGARVSRAGSAVTDAGGNYRIDITCTVRDFGFGTTIISVQAPGYEGAFEFDGRSEGTSTSGIRRIDFAMKPVASSNQELPVAWPA